MSRHKNLIATDTPSEPAGIARGHISNKELHAKYNLFKRLSESNADPFMVMDKLYEVADGMIKKAYPVNECQRGCSHCCYVAVHITGLEAQHIESRTGHRVRQFKSGKSDPSTWEPCSFLKDNECSIYEHRPMACRAFLTFDDAELCTYDHFGENHWVLALSEPGGGGFDWLNQVFFMVLTTYLRRYENWQVFADIRHYFGADGNE